MSIEHNKAVLRKWIEEGWNQGQLNVADEVYAPDVVQHDPSSLLPVTSVEALKAYVGTFRQAMPDIHFITTDLVAEGDKVLWRFTVSGTQTGLLGPIPPSGRPVTVAGMALFRLAAGRIAEVWVNFDALGFYQQLGLMPVPA